MFWGLILEPGKRYSQKVAKAFHVSMATLEVSDDGSNENVPVLLEYEDGREYMLCNLQKGKIMQCALDLNFREGERIGFYSGIAKSRVHLTGYLIDYDDIDELESSDPEDEEEAVSGGNSQKRKESPTDGGGRKKIKLTDAFDQDDDDDDEDDDDYEGLEEEEDEAEEEEDDEEEEDEDEEDDSDELTTPSGKKQKMAQQTPNDRSKKEINQSPKTPKEQNGQVKTPHSQKKNKKLGETPKPGTPKPGTPKSNTPQKKTLQGGVAVEDSVVGNGPVAKPGTKVVVYYVGRLQQNNKQFDSTTSGPGFKFNLGRSEVIKGWDIGVSGMRVGGKRTITIPAHMAYGKKGQPPVIPPNSTLVFDVELRGVN